jgi:alkylation response protein AidB-like acyl-CoA dehydrogenase
MEYHASLEHRRFRAKVRDWLRANRPAAPRPDDFAGQIAYDRDWQGRQHEAGWAGLSWPERYGGRGLSATHQLIWLEEYAAADCPLLLDSCWLGQNHAGPTLMARGTEEQKSFHLPRILSGQATWCQGFSEPGAGSDMANIQTRGVVDGDALVVTGQKIWTTFAHLADYQELLVRTGSADSRHRGLTWVICDMRLPGIDVRPIKALSGEYHNCEIFYDAVRIPLANVVGEIDGGWSVAMTTFDFERGSAQFGKLCELGVALESLVAYAGAHPGPSGHGVAIRDPAIADRLGAFRAQLQSLRAVAQMMVSAAEGEVALGAEGLILNLPFAELAQAIFRFAMELLGSRGLNRAVAGRWLQGYFEAFSHTIAGGTAEIQRNIIAERLLGLPR